MTIHLTKTHVQAIANLDFADLGYLQRVNLIAKALGYRNQATLMAVLEKSGPEALQPKSAGPSKNAGFLSLKYAKPGPGKNVQLFPEDSPSLDALKIPDASEWKAALTDNGIFLVCGKFGDGVMTTLTASAKHIIETRGASVAVAGGGTEYETISHLAKTHDVVLWGVHASTMEEARDDLKRSGMPKIEIGFVSALFMRLDNCGGEYDVHSRYVHKGFNNLKPLATNEIVHDLGRLIAAAQRA